MYLEYSHPYDCEKFVDCNDYLNPAVESCDSGLVYLHPTGCVSPQYTPCAGIDAPDNETGTDYELLFLSLFSASLVGY